MDLKTLRQVLKALGDDTRLRILNLLMIKELTVKTIHTTLKMNQPTVSKHLIRLRLLKIVNDRREGNVIYYSINKEAKTLRIIRLLFSEFGEIEILKKDKNCLKKENELQKRRYPLG